MRLGNPRNNWNEEAKERIWTTYYGCQTISIKSGAIGHGAIFEQNLESNIIFIETFNGTKRIELHKGGNIKPKVLKKFYLYIRRIFMR
jgi:hypothetical protein